MNHPYIVSMLETQFKLEEQLKELDEVLKEPLPALLNCPLSSRQANKQIILYHA